MPGCGQVVTSSGAVHFEHVHQHCAAGTLPVAAGHAPSLERGKEGTFVMSTSLSHSWTCGSSMKGMQSRAGKAPAAIGVV